MSGLCNHSLELTGLAGDPASPVHRLDPRAKIVGLVAVTIPLALVWGVLGIWLGRAQQQRVIDADGSTPARALRREEAVAL